MKTEEGKKELRHIGIIFIIVVALFAGLLWCAVNRLDILKIIGMAIVIVVGVAASLFMCWIAAVFIYEAITHKTKSQ